MIDCKEVVVVGGGLAGSEAAQISESVKKCEVIAYEDLGAEAIHRLEVEDFYAIVTYDSEGNDLFEQGIEQYKK